MFSWAILASSDWFLVTFPKNTICVGVKSKWSLETQNMHFILLLFKISCIFLAELYLWTGCIYGWDLEDIDSSSDSAVGPLTKLRQMISFPICKNMIMLCKALWGVWLRKNSNKGGVTFVELLIYFFLNWDHRHSKSSCSAQHTKLLFYPIYKTALALT